MIVTLDINPETGKVRVLEIIKDSEETQIPTLFVESNKVRLNKSAVELFGNENVSIRYEADGTPIIGKASAFGEKGTKISKVGTIIYKGANHEVLSKLGDKFTLVPYKEGICKLISPDKIKEKTEAAMKEIQADYESSRVKQISLDIDDGFPGAADRLTDTNFDLDLSDLKL